MDMTYATCSGSGRMGETNIFSMARNKVSLFSFSNFIQRFCNRLKLDKEVSEHIMNICNIAVENNIISENTPPSIAAGCIFYYSKEYKLNLTKKQISDVCKISEVTINKCTKKIEKEEHLFVNREIYTEK